MDYFRLVQKTIDMIEENICEKIKVSDLAGAAYCSEAHFSRIFHSIVGMSIMDYIRCRKLSIAGKELAFTQIKVIDTALKYGYETPEAFTKAFKKYHGISPAICRKTCLFKYQKRFFPLVVKLKNLEGAIDMSNFGSPLIQILDDLEKSSNNMYYCFNSHNNRYAIKAIEVEEIHSLKNLYQNTKNELYLLLRNKKIPVIQADGTDNIGDATIYQQNILICVTRRLNDSQETSVNNYFGLLIDKNPELKILKSISSIENVEKQYINSIGQFDDEQTLIISTQKLYNYIKNNFTNTLDKSEEIFIDNNTEDSDIIKRLEYAAYDAELLATNASIEAVHGMQHHKGTMVIAYELHQHAVELAKIVHELREQSI